MYTERSAWLRLRLFRLSAMCIALPGLAAFCTHTSNSIHGAACVHTNEYRGGRATRCVVMLVAILQPRAALALKCAIPEGLPNSPDDNQPQGDSYAMMCKFTEVLMASTPRTVEPVLADAVDKHDAQPSHSAPWSPPETMGTPLATELYAGHLYTAKACIMNYTHTLLLCIAVPTTYPRCWRSSKVVSQLSASK